MLLITPNAEAVCGTWNPIVLATATGGAESASITISWSSAPPSACSNPPAPPGDNWGGTNKLTLRRAEGSTPPSTANSGTLVANMSAATTTITDTMHRSGKDYAYALFACESALCVSQYGDGSGSYEVATNTTALAQTDFETWELTDVTGPTDVSSVAVDDQDANAPHVFFYPTDWSLSLGNRMGLYYSEAAGGSVSKVYYTINDSTGWPTGALNDPASWATATLVAEGSADSGDHDYKADHPWAMLTREAGYRRVQLFLQSQDRTNKEVLQIESTDEVGDDFGLCSGGTCSSTLLDGDGYVAIAADGGSGTDYVVHAQHGRVGWNYLGDPYIDAGTDYPFMMFNMKRPGSSSCADPGSHDDVARAEGAWNGLTWDWTVVTDGGSPDCPVVQVTDVHDNTLVPLPNGEYKLYYKQWNSPYEWYVIYWDGATWGDEVPIDFDWDGSSSGPSHDCIENVSAVVHVTSGTARSAMAFKLLDGAGCGTGLDDDGGVNAGDDAAIVFAELTN